ncbi:MAG: hypothetical protein M4579_007047 [Chaenotheca gracillima]|nr:MAG: hypothetical protein M4579_007047 [Chaenotheca gracillima]
MFDILEADIVVMQETKIQRKDLRDDMVLVPGWDCYFSLPRHKKGYSGVVIYTRQSVCSPIRAEEGITGILELPNSSTSFRDLPESEQIGGYPTPAQLADTPVDATNLDSEGRCVLLEFPAFVLIGVYSPANRDETRDDFRLSFVNALDARVRNLHAIGKRVILTGDLNISAAAIDSAHAEEALKKQATTIEEIVSSPARRIFNQLVVGGQIFGGKDEGREEALMWDICRGFHEGRKGMFTCWEQKINARPGNFGARIDYVLASKSMRDWFCDSNIQEGLMGSDHCPVYAVIKDKIIIDEKEVNVKDVMNAPGMFEDGIREKEYSMKGLPALSGKLIPEFDKRRSIRDMFTRKPSISTQRSESDASISHKPDSSADQQDTSPIHQLTSTNGSSQSPGKAAQTSKLPTVVESPSPKRGVAPGSASASPMKRAPPSETFSSPKAQKRSKSTSTPATATLGKGQQSLKGFFKPKTPASQNDDGSSDIKAATTSSTTHPPESTATDAPSSAEARRPNDGLESSAPTSGDLPSSSVPSQDEEVHDPIVSKESWSKLFTKREPPRCDSHKEPCISLTTKKSGANCGRAFWMCPRYISFPISSGASSWLTMWD